MVVLDSKVFIEAAGLDLFWRCNSTTFLVTCYSSSDLLWTQDELLSWGIISLTIAYIWQLYTLWILVQLHEAVPGKRYNRYVELAQAAFGERLDVWLALFPTVYLSAGTAKALILIGGETIKLLFQIVCGPLCSSNPLTTVGDKSKWKLNHPCGRCYPCWLCHVVGAILPTTAIKALNTSTSTHSTKTSYFGVQVFDYTSKEL